MKKMIAIFALCLFGFFGLTQAPKLSAAGATEITPLMAPASSDDVEPQK